LDFKSGFVAIIGRPNVGKSTLLNQLVGKKISIISPKPQTTRNSIKGILTQDDAQIVFIDTPGVHPPKNKLGEYMIRVSEKTLKEVDLILYMIEATDKGIGPWDEMILNKINIKQGPFLKGPFPENILGGVKYALPVRSKRNNKGISRIPCASECGFRSKPRRNSWPCGRKWSRKINFG